MAKSRPPYSPEFRHQMVELVRSGRTPSELAREFAPSAQAIGTWVRQAANTNCLLKSHVRVSECFDRFANPLPPRQPLDLFGVCREGL